MLKEMLKCKQVIPLMATLLTPVLVIPAEAVTVNIVTRQDPFGMDVTGIGSVEDIIIIERGVQLPGDDFTSRITSTYRIDFLYGLFSEIFGDPNQDFQCNIGVSQSLCFWENDAHAELVIDRMNSAFNSFEPPPIPENVLGEPINIPPFNNLSNNYLIPKGFDSNQNLIISRQGRYDGQEWVTEAADFSNTVTADRVYGSTTLTAQEIVAEIPEASNVIGILVTGLSMIVLTKKK